MPQNDLSSCSSTLGTATFSTCWTTRLEYLVSFDVQVAPVRSSCEEGKPNIFCYPPLAVLLDDTRTISQNVVQPIKRRSVCEKPIDLVYGLEHVPIR